MDDLLELTGRAEATHFWFRGFRKFVAPVLERSRRRPGRPPAGRLRLRHRTQPAPAAAARPGVRVRSDAQRSGARARRQDGLVLRGDVTRIPLASETFDVATAFDVLQCVDADVAALREMARIVRPGGAVVVTLAALEVLRGDHAEVWQRSPALYAGDGAPPRRSGGPAGRARVVHVRVDVSAGGRGPLRAAPDAPFSRDRAPTVDIAVPSCAGELDC